MKINKSIRNNRITVSHLLRRIKRNYCSNIYEKTKTDDKTLWKMVTPLLPKNV